MNIEQAMHVNFEAVHLALSFCTGGDVRYAMRRPFLQGEHVYATNGIIIARVPKFCAPWVTDADYPGRTKPDCHLLPWAPELYTNKKTPWASSPKPKIPICDRCEEIKGGADFDPDSLCSIYELCDFDDPPQICKRCMMYTASERGQDVTLGFSVFNTRICRRLATIGAEMYAPLSGNGLDAWRWEIPDIKMVGLVMPVKKGGQ